jgi:hypothetical protein
MLGWPVRAPSSARLLLSLVTAALALVAASPDARGGAARIEDVEDSLAHDHSYKVRAEAAIVLGRLHRPRSVPALLGALRDPHPVVRATAADALARIGSPAARDGLATAAKDPSPLVRRVARAALQRLGGPSGQPGQDGQGGAPDQPPPGVPAIRARAEPPLSFEVPAMGDRSHHAGEALRSHMRDFLIGQLRPHGEIAAGRHQGMFVVDGVIKDLATRTRNDQVEVSCAVQLVVSRQPGGGVFLLTSGEAIVQKPKRQWRPQLRPALELEALENAVRGASEDLIQHLGR